MRSLFGLFMKTMTDKKFECCGMIMVVVIIKSKETCIMSE